MLEWREACVKALSAVKSCQVPPTMNGGGGGGDWLYLGTRGAGSVREG